MREFDPIVDAHRSFGYFPTCLDDGYRDAAAQLWLPLDEDYVEIGEFALEGLGMWATTPWLLEKLEEQMIMRLHGSLE